jgi:hypothetical protein
MQNVSVVARFPIRDTGIGSDGLFVDDTAVLAEFLGQVPHALMALDRRVLSATVSMQKECAENLTDVLRHSPTFSFMLHSFVEIQAEVAVDDDWLRAANPTRNVDSRLICVIAAMIVSETVEHLLLLSELAYPGCVDTDEGIATVGNDAAQRIRAKGAFKALRFPEEHDRSWPPVSVIGLPAVVSWIEAARPFAEGLAKTRVQRVMAAYTHAVGLTQHREGEVLFRAMQGLEAFYSEGSGDLRKQLAEKVALWLGPWQEKKNIIGQLYDSRSKFVHGSSPLEYWNDHEEPLDEDEPRLVELSASAIFALRLLIATLQKCASDSVADVSWKYAVEIVYGRSGSGATDGTSRD